MKPRVVGLVVALTLLVPLLFLAKYNIEFSRDQEQLTSRTKQDTNNQIRPVSWFESVKRTLYELAGFDLITGEEYELFEPVKQGHLNYRKYANSSSNFISPVSPSTTGTISDGTSQEAPAERQSTEVHLNGSRILNNSEENKTNHIDLLSTFRMNREAIGHQPPKDGDDDGTTPSVRCHNSRYDRLIAQKISMNDISRPIIAADGRFGNPFSTWNKQSFSEILKFMIWEKDESGVPKNRDELDKELPEIKPDFSRLQQDDNSEFRVTWIGHSTLLIQVDGYNILTDPMFSERASFTQFFGPKRIRPPACDIKSLPPIDIVLVSHNHYDHLDENSVHELNKRFGRDCRWVVPLGLGEFLRSMSVKNYVELDWWQKDCYLINQPTISQPGLRLSPISTTSNNNNDSTIQARSISSSSNNNHQSVSDTSNGKSWNQRTQRPELDIYLTPSQHWSRRGINDVNKSLWGSFTIVSKYGSTFFFGGDTGYCSAFKEIGRVFGPFTGAAIPIGAYKPRGFLKTSHVDPIEAVQIHRDLRSMKSIAIHHSTFILSYEHYKEPSNLLKETMDKLRASGTVKEPFITLKHGETAQFYRTS